MRRFLEDQLVPLALLIALMAFGHGYWRTVALAFAVTIAAIDVLTVGVVALRHLHWLSRRHRRRETPWIV